MKIKFINNTPQNFNPLISNELKIHHFLILFLILFCSVAYGQMEQFSYAREIEKPSEQWHEVKLPNEIFGQIKSDFSDLRIYGISEQKDTIEAPYILQSAIDKVSKKSVDFRRLNESHNENGYYFTFEIPNTQSAINQLQLDFKPVDFDWRINLEGSQNQREWFKLAEDYRIVSIQNNLANYSFTTVAFPNAKYRYLRLLVKSKTNPQLTTARLSLQETVPGNYQKYPSKSLASNNNKTAQQTNIEVNLGLAVPVSSLQLTFKDEVDFYRKVQVQYLADSFAVDQGWKYTYNTLINSTLTSFQENELSFTPTVLKRLKITISNNDNAPLNLDELTVKGPIYQLVSRFAEPANYALYYGNPQSRRPNYDLNRFATNIPNQPPSLQLGNEIILKKTETQPDQSLFQNKLWLWALMLVIIALLGWFSMQMLRKG